MKYGISAKEAVQMTTCAMCDQCKKHNIKTVSVFDLKSKNIALVQIVCLTKCQCKKTTGKK